MARILVVDDCASQRCLIDYVLRQSGEHEVQLSGNVEDALTLLDTVPFDCLVTDWVMPERSGRDLLAEAQQSNPQLPVIVVTATGSEEMAVGVLKAGAAAYIPKRMLAAELEETVEYLVRRSLNQLTKRRLLEKTNTFSQEISLGNHQDTANEVIEHFLGIIERMKCLPKDEITRVGVALHEAVTNSIIHGNLEVSSELRGVDDQGYSALVKSRLQSEPYSSRDVVVGMRVDKARVSFTVADEGPGFDVTKVANPTDEDNLLKASGRGLIMMNAFMDDVKYNSTGNAVTMIKNREHATAVEVSEQRTPNVEQQAVTGGHFRDRSASRQQSTCN